jgi:thiamine biosynthesis protein ThiC
MRTDAGDRAQVAESIVLGELVNYEQEKQVFKQW